MSAPPPPSLGFLALILFLFCFVAQWSGFLLLFRKSSQMKKRPTSAVGYKRPISQYARVAIKMGAHSRYRVGAHVKGIYSWNKLIQMKTAATTTHPPASLSLLIDEAVPANRKLAEETKSWTGPYKSNKLVSLCKEEQEMHRGRYSVRAGCLLACPVLTAQTSAARSAPEGAGLRAGSRWAHVTGVKESGDGVVNVLLPVTTEVPSPLWGTKILRAAPSMLMQDKDLSM